MNTIVQDIFEQLGRTAPGKAITSDSVHGDILQALEKSEVGILTVGWCYLSTLRRRLMWDADPVVRATLDQVGVGVDSFLAALRMADIYVAEIRNVHLTFSDVDDVLIQFSRRMAVPDGLLRRQQEANMDKLIRLLTPP